MADYDRLSTGKGSSPCWAAKLIVNDGELIMVFGKMKHCVYKILTVFTKNPGCANDVVIS